MACLQINFSLLISSILIAEWDEASQICGIHFVNDYFINQIKNMLLIYIKHKRNDILLTKGKTDLDNEIQSIV